MNSNYNQLLRQKILDAIKAQQLSLCDIIKLSQGAYPDDVIASLSDLIANKLVSQDNGVFTLTNHHTPLKRSKIDPSEPQNDLSWIDAILSKLSAPHPADYDWRFTNQTIYDLSNLIQNDVEQYPSVALFGTTTLFPIIKKLSPITKVTLYNRSASLIKDLRKMGFDSGLFLQDLFLKIPYSDKYKLVIADPPWYNDFYTAFICRASEILDLGGHLFLSVLPLLTRPDAQQDREDIDKCCRENGLEKIESFEGYLSYESPTFEKLSLAKNGVDCSDWRKGDLIIYKKVHDIEISVDTSPPEDEPIWDEYVINGVKLKLAHYNQEYKDKFSFEPSDITNTLSTVSRRSPIRKRINFWTSENIAFKVSKLKVLHNLLRFANTYKSLEKALRKIKIEENLTEEEFNSLIDLLKIANVIHSG